MRRFIVATHGYLANGLKTAMELIVGKNANVSYFCAYVDETKDILRDVEDQIATYEQDDEIVIFTDLYGGSVNNQMTALLTNKNVHLITGTNLLLLIGITLAGEGGAIESIIRTNIEEAKNGIVYCNDTVKVEAEQLDEF